MTKKPDKQFMSMVNTPTVIDLCLDTNTVKVTNPDGSSDTIPVTVNAIVASDLASFMQVWDLPLVPKKGRV